MAAAVGTSFNWVSVPGGVWTRFGAGPLISGIPFQALELIASGGMSGSITFTLDAYSANLPFYERDTGTTSVGVSTSTPVGHTGNWAAILSYRSTPYIEFWILPSRPCWAHISLL